jgi:hypothetical protein
VELRRTTALILEQAALCASGEKRGEVQDEQEPWGALYMAERGKARGIEAVEVELWRWGAMMARWSSWAPVSGG